ncbi:MAG: WYL domain-containing protein [Phascolarctobacterium sp.]|nr:WYL domain-containing protein [Phascolarctobacterium sp.]
MSNVFSEVYGTYYNVVAKVLTQAVQGKLSLAQLQQIVSSEAYEDSILQLLPALKEGTWRLLTPELATPVQHTPIMPLTTLQKRWLKALCLDERLSLFLDDAELALAMQALEGVEPLYKPEQFVFFDRYVDGDDFRSERYRANFRKLLQAMRERKLVDASYRNNKDRIIIWTNLVPLSLEYSAKDDKFRLQAVAGKKLVTLNLNKLITADFSEEENVSTYYVHAARLKEQRQRLVLELEDTRHTLMRAMLHFSDLAKETQKLDDMHYLLTVDYDQSDETEMLYRVLSFGPTIKVREPESFKELLRQKLLEQLSCHNK